MVESVLVNKLTPAPPQDHVASKFLAAIDVDWARLVQAVGACRLETKPAREPYEALIRAIAYQQLHSKAGDAILGRLLLKFPSVDFPSPRQLLDANPDVLRACGFSARKLQTILTIAEAAISGGIPSGIEAATLSNGELIARLSILKGIGRWTVEMFLIYTMQRADVLPVDDFGVRNGYRLLKSLTESPKPRQLALIGAAWSPYRTSAAWYLWRAGETLKR